MFNYNVKWSYGLSPLLSDHLNRYKVIHPQEILDPPRILERGSITTTDVSNTSDNENDCRELILKWGIEVYNSWTGHHKRVDKTANGFIKRNKGLFQT